jgi:alpha/beta superfamily hydrolase
VAGLARAWPAATVTTIDGADHFFAGGVDALHAALADWATKLPR